MHTHTHTHTHARTPRTQPLVCHGARDAQELGQRRVAVHDRKPRHRPRLAARPRGLVGVALVRVALVDGAARGVVLHNVVGAAVRAHVVARDGARVRDRHVDPVLRGGMRGGGGERGGRGCGEGRRPGPPREPAARLRAAASARGAHARGAAPALARRACGDLSTQLWGPPILAPSSRICIFIMWSRMTTCLRGGGGWGASTRRGAGEGAACGVRRGQRSGRSGGGAPVALRRRRGVPALKGARAVGGRVERPRRRLGGGQHLAARLLGARRGKGLPKAGQVHEAHVVLQRPVALAAGEARAPPHRRRAPLGLACEGVQVPQHAGPKAGRPVARAGGDAPAVAARCVGVLRGAGRGCSLAVGAGRRCAGRRRRCCRRCRRARAGRRTSSLLSCAAVARACASAAATTRATTWAIGSRTSSMVAFLHPPCLKAHGGPIMQRPALLGRRAPAALGGSSDVHNASSSARARRAAAPRAPIAAPPRGC